MHFLLSDARLFSDVKHSHRRMAGGGTYLLFVVCRQNKNITAQQDCGKGNVINRSKIT